MFDNVKAAIGDRAERRVPLRQHLLRPDRPAAGDARRAEPIFSRIDRYGPRGREGAVQLAWSGSRTRAPTRTR